jgi:hypothetical protein
MAGRPSTYNNAKADEICDRLAGGESLLKICQDDLIPPQSVVFQWLHRNPEFAEKYARARESWAEAEFERMFEIADTVLIGEKVKTSSDGTVETITGDMVERAKLQVDARKWALARMSVRRFGDRQAIEHSGPGGTPISVSVVNIPGKAE